MTDTGHVTPPMRSLHAPGDAAGMPSLADRYAAGVSYDAMVASARKNVELYRNFRARAEAPAEYAARIAATGRRWRLLVMSEDWCGDSVNILPWIDALAASSDRTEMRIIGRDDHLDLMDRHLTDGRSRAIPIAILLDDAFIERGWWGPRPAALQEWFWSADAQALTKDERYKELRLRYARDRGRAILEELTVMIERAAAQDAAADAATAIAAS